MDRAGPRLQAVIEINPEAASIAAALEASQKAGVARGPLWGLPVLVKDNLDTGDRMMTSAGSLALTHAPAPQDSTVVARLREAGALLLGKTNLSEWANIRSPQSSSGWSARGGQTVNPYRLDRSPSGSSSGSAAAVAANLCGFAIGTETDGSIVSPASVCGIVGLKPTVGAVSRAGIVPISATQDTAGPMTRSVRDAARVMGAIAGYDPRDPATLPMRGRVPDYTRFLDAAALRGARIGVARGLWGPGGRGAAVMEESLAALRALGADLVDPVELPTVNAIGEHEITVLLYELKAGLASYLATRPDAPVRSIEDVIEFNRREAEREQTWFGQEFFERAAALGPLTDQAYVDALASCRRLSRQDGIDAALAKHRLDAIVAPTNNPAWPIDWVNGDHFVSGCSTLPAVAGYPHLTVPAGQVGGLPIGLSFFGPAWSEPRLLGFGYAFEQATRARRAPEFLLPGAALA